MVRFHHLILLVALILGWLFGNEALPKSHESFSRYTSRLVAHCEQTLEDAYVKLLLFLPGLAHAEVGSESATTSLELSGSSSQDAKKAIEDAEQKANVLKQGIAANELEIDAQQKVSARRYAEAKGEQEAIANANADEVWLAPEQPDEVRSKMPKEGHIGAAMRCDQAIPSESDVITRNIEVHVRSIFQSAFGSHFGWKYIVTFRNHGSETVQMLTRHWLFVDASGRLETEVKGPGARGVTPVLLPGGEWSYESGTSLQTPYGSMHGSFQFEVLKGDLSSGKRSFSARVGRLALSPDQSPREIPCIDEDTETLLPATSVLSTERVIVGVTGSFIKRIAPPKTQRKMTNNSYVFSYDVQINNARDFDIEVIGHMWEVVDSERRRHTISDGQGVGGGYQKRSRRLAAGDAFRVDGQLISPTPEANAQGTYIVLLHSQAGSTTQIEVRTDFMGLSANKLVTHVANFVVDPSFR